jgi:hypothetical protein
MSRPTTVWHVAVTGSAPGAWSAQAVLRKVCERLHLHLATNAVRRSDLANLHPLLLVLLRLVFNPSNSRILYCRRWLKLLLLLVSSTCRHRPLPLSKCHLRPCCTSPRRCGRTSLRLAAGWRLAEACGGRPSSGRRHDVHGARQLVGSVLSVCVQPGVQSKHMWALGHSMYSCCAHNVTGPVVPAVSPRHPSSSP